MSSLLRTFMLVLSALIISIIACTSEGAAGFDELVKKATNQPGEAQQVAPESTLASSPQPSIPQTQPPTLFPDDCFWKYIDDTEALATGGGDPNMSAQRNGSSITTSYTHAGNFGCSEQTFNTTHDWSTPPNFVYPGDEISFNVGLSWELVGTPECTSLTAGASTYVTAGDTTFKADIATINLSADPQGLVFSDSGTWIVGPGSVGDTMNITAHGSSGSLGGTVTYHYQYVCEATG